MHTVYWTAYACYIDQYPRRARDLDLWSVRVSAGRWIYHSLLRLISSLVSRVVLPVFDLVTESVRNVERNERRADAINHPARRFTHRYLINVIYRVALYFLSFLKEAKKFLPSLRRNREKIMKRSCRKRKRGGGEKEIFTKSSGVVVFEDDGRSRTCSRLPVKI